MRILESCYRPIKKFVKKKMDIIWQGEGKKYSFLSETNIFNVSQIKKLIIFNKSLKSPFWAFLSTAYVMWRLCSSVYPHILRISRVTYLIMKSTWWKGRRFFGTWYSGILISFSFKIFLPVHCTFRYEYRISYIYICIIYIWL